MTSIKRPRTPSQSTSSNPTSPTASTTHSLASGYNHPPHKSTRIVPNSSNSSLSPRSIGGTSTSSGSTIKGAIPSETVGGTGTNVTPLTRHPLLCTLPPTCHRHPTPIADTNDLERHYATYHAHVCGVKGCGCVFPDGRLLELHQTECHDPIAALRKERGEKIFQCHLPSPTCGRNFLTPKARRLHLIQAHAFPKEFFFAVTNKGVGGLLKKWGEGASLIRKEWKAREEAGTEGGGGGSVDMKSYRAGEDGMVVDDEDDEDGDDGDEDDEEEEEESDDLEATPRMLPRRTIGVNSPPSSLSSPPDTHVANNSNGGSSNNHDLTNLTESLDSLSLVPNSIRFGRGGKSGGFLPRGQGRARGGGNRGHGGKHSRSDRGIARSGGTEVMEVDVVPMGTGALIVPGTKLRGRGRGRGGFAPRANGRGRGRGVAQAAA